MVNTNCSVTGLITDAAQVQCDMFPFPGEVMSVLEGCFVLGCGISGGGGLHSKKRRFLAPLMLIQKNMSPISIMWTYTQLPKKMCSGLR